MLHWWLGETIVRTIVLTLRWGERCELGCWDRWEHRRRLRPRTDPAWGRLAVPGPSGWCACLAGCARLGCGSWPGFRAGRASPSLEPEMFDVQSAFDAAAVDGEGCGLDCLWANLFRYQPVGDTPRPGSPPQGGAAVRR